MVVWETPPGPLSARPAAGSPGSLDSSVSRLPGAPDGGLSLCRAVGCFQFCFIGFNRLDYE